MNKRRLISHCMLLALVITSSHEATAQTAEVVANVFGKEVTATDLDTGDLSTLIWDPILAELSEANGLEPSADQIDAYLAATNESFLQLLEGLGLDEDLTSRQIEGGQRSAAREIVHTWNVSKFLFEKHGGRVVFQQGNPMEPVDAYRELLERHRAKGDFQIFNEAQRDAFWSYYLNDPVNVIPADQVDFSTPWWSRLQDGEDAALPGPTSLSSSGCLNNWICGNGFEFHVSAGRRAPTFLCQLDDPNFSTSECSAHDPVCDPAIRSNRVDGCSGPSNPFDSFFRRACDEHDVCYGTPGMAKGGCDSNFLNDLDVLCQGSPVMPVCYPTALAFYEAVQQFGDDAYQGDQRYGRDHCKPDNLSYESGLNPGFCVDALNGDPANGTNVQIYECNGTNAQRWAFDNTGEILSALRKNVCLDVLNGAVEPGTNVQIFQCNLTNAQLWTFTEQGTISSGPNLCLDVSHAIAANGTNVQIFQCNETPAQQWTFQQTGGGQGVFRSALGDFCLDVLDARFRPGNNVQIYKCNNTNAQKWLVSGGVIFSDDRSLCLDVNKGRVASGANVQIYNCNGTSAQRWGVGDMAVHSRVNDVTKNLCLSVADTRAENGVNIQVSTCDGSPGQSWVQRVN